MAQPYVGEIRMFAGNFAIAGWMFCEGQLLPISEFETLFNLIGTTFGGDGQSTFALPNLQSRIPVHQGSDPFILGQAAGTEQVTLTTAQIPTHNHDFVASTTIATQSSPSNTTLSQSTLAKMYYADVTDVSLAPKSILPTGGGQPHDNLQPFLCINFIISLYGIYPQQS